YAVGVLARDSHESRKSGAGADKDRGKALFIHQLVDGNGLADDYVGLDLNAKLSYVLDLRLYNGLFGKTEFGNSICKNSARLMKRFKDRYVIAQLRQIARAGKAGRAGTDHGNLLALLLRSRLRNK